METTREAIRVIEEIQRSYYLHSDDIALRAKDPNGMDSLRNKETIESWKKFVKLYVSDDRTH